MKRGPWRSKTPSIGLNRTGDGLEVRDTRFANRKCRSCSDHEVVALSLQTLVRILRVVCETFVYTRRGHDGGCSGVSLQRLVLFVRWNTVPSPLSATLGTTFENETRIANVGGRRLGPDEVVALMVRLSPRLRIPFSNPFQNGSSVWLRMIDGSNVFARLSLWELSTSSKSDRTRPSRGDNAMQIVVWVSDLNMLRYRVVGTRAFADVGTIESARAGLVALLRTLQDRNQQRPLSDLLSVCLQVVGSATSAATIKDAACIVAT